MLSKSPCAFPTCQNPSILVLRTSAVSASLPSTEVSRSKWCIIHQGHWLQHWPRAAMLWENIIVQVYWLCKARDHWVHWCWHAGLSTRTERDLFSQHLIGMWLSVQNNACSLEAPVISSFKGNYLCQMHLKSKQECKCRFGGSKTILCGYGPVGQFL